MTTSTVTVYTADEVAQMLRCNRETVYRWRAAGKLKSCERAEGQRAHLFLPEHVEEFLNGPKPASTPAAPKPARNPRKTYAS